MPWLAASWGITGFDTKEKESKDLITGWQLQLTTTNNFPAPEAKVHKDRAKWVNTQFAACSRKYFGTYPAELNTKPKRDPA